jgi:hypothetical protein
MDEDLESLAKEAARIAQTLPEQFQEKCFEVLLNSFVAKKAPVDKAPPEQETKKTGGKPREFVVPLSVRAFLQQYSVSEESLPKIFLMHGTDVAPAYKLQTTKKATAQVQIAVLTALENALKGGKFEFSVEEVRKRCDEHGAYDAANFAATFKKRKDLFKDQADEEHVELSSDGKAELAETITEMAK